MYTRSDTFVSTVTVEYSPERTNLTLTCMLTCAQQCEKDFSLSWRGGGSQLGRQTSLEAESNTVTSQLLVPAPPVGPAEVTCCVLREGAMVTSKTWRSANCKSVHHSYISRL